MLLVAVLITGCGGGGGTPLPAPPAPAPPAPPPAAPEPEPGPEPTDTLTIQQQIKDGFLWERGVTKLRLTITPEGSSERFDFNVDTLEFSEDGHPIINSAILNWTVVFTAADLAAAGGALRTYSRQLSDGNWITLTFGHNLNSPSSLDELGISIGLEYVNFVNWQGFDGDLGSGLRRVGSGWFGIPTPADRVPTTGTASYDAFVSGIVGRNAAGFDFRDLGGNELAAAPITGRATFLTDFRTGMIDATFTNMVWTDPFSGDTGDWVDFSGAATIGAFDQDRSHFDGDLSTPDGSFSGDFEGRFFGPSLFNTPEEIGGTWSLGGEVGSAFGNFVGGDLSRRRSDQYAAGRGTLAEIIEVTSRSSGDIEFDPTASSFGVPARIGEFTQAGGSGNLVLHICPSCETFDWDSSLFGSDLDVTFVTGNDLVSTDTDSRGFEIRRFEKDRPGGAGTDDMLVATPGAGLLEYVTFGMWALEGFDDPLVVQAFVYGLRTPEEDIPATGSASYEGVAQGRRFNNANQQWDIAGDVQIDVDFATSQVDGQMTNMEIRTIDLASGALGAPQGWFDFTIAGSLNQAGGGATGLAVNAVGAGWSGDANLSFFGPANPFPLQVGGSWQVKDGATDSAFGTFIGKLPNP